MDISENIVIEEINEGDDGKITKHYVVKSGDDSGKGEAKFVVVKKIGEEYEGDELKTEIELIVGDDKGMHKFHTDEGKTIILGGENVHGKAIKHSIHKNDKGNVFFFEGDGEGNEFIFDVKKKEGNQISLDAKGNGDYRLEFVSDELEPIKVEVFDGEGNKLFKKKVKNFYGRFLKDLNLQGNDSGLFTVRVLQGEKEIIGEFEFK